ncbi:TetR/AcrR family transcriptional regulator [Segniliparus rugosus]|uniref:HTH tetR-type domain-containing protein n=1 Tax=Segniliparus rugosus (strain ATCC BAA-974 / DSM 45345 / CCUG 50838 / CIP 108380 / JCM 13579 / CDC 945) TaxID=679197 RepID=E5XPA0_SEGRC|nr:TetR/AcrR family transcriptional regulator [Segniliparus rugosus]EFV13825.1 hypothetical protein HMPREF9336_01322 [Segniliparus rugosus ATCC BAA-974]
MSAARRPPAYRKGATVDRAVLEAARELLAAEGLGGARIADVAALAGVHETSIYRRWGSRAKLIAAALSDQVDAELALPDTGSAREDLILFYTVLAEFLATLAGRSVASLVFAATQDEASFEEARAQFWDLRLARARLLVHRGVERAELDPDVDPEIVVESVAGALNLHILLRNKTADRDYISGLVDLALDGARPRPASTPLSREEPSSWSGLGREFPLAIVLGESGSAWPMGLYRPVARRTSMSSPNTLAPSFRFRIAETQPGLSSNAVIATVSG